MFDYNEFYKKQGVDFIASPTRFSLVASLCKGRVADIGCCFGALSDFYDGEYFGFDFAEFCLEKAREVRRKTAVFTFHDCSDLTDIAIENFDTFVFAEFLEHFKDDTAILGPVLQRAKKGTRIVITIPNGDRIPDESHERTLTIPELRKKLSPFGRVRFYNWEQAERHIVCTCDIGEPERADLSLVMIVKNEEKGLERCLLSAIDYVDEIIVAVDNSTTDKTLEIATRYADVVKRFDWADDFAKARNDAQEGAKGRWLLFLDGHEYIKKCEKLDVMLATPADGLMCTIEMDNNFEFQNPRIYRNGIKFVGAVHEKQELSLVFRYPNFVVKHDRDNGQDEAAVLERKRQRNDQVPRLMTAQWKKDHKNTRASFHLGLHYTSRLKKRLALKWFRRYLRYSKNPGERWYVFFHLSLSALGEKKLFRAFWYANRAENEVPNRWEIRKMFGLIYFERGYFSEAAEYFISTFDNNKGFDEYKPWQKDDGGTWNAIGECFFQLGQYDKACISFATAADRATDTRAKKFFTDRSELMRDLTKSSVKSMI